MRGLALLLIALVACTRAHESKDPPPTPTPTPTPWVPVPGKESRTLLLQRHAHTDADAAYVAITIPADPKAKPAHVDLGKRPADPMPGQGYHRALAAHDDQQWVYVRDKTKLVVATIGAATTVTIDVAPIEPLGLHLAGNALYIGTDRAVCWIDLAKVGPKPCITLVDRAGYANKAYDRFVRLGDRLLAVDDEVMPMFADWFAIDADGRPIERLGDWELPAVINGHYDHAALLATGANEYTLYMIAPYGILSGDGHVLAAVPIRGGKLVFDPNLTLQNRDGKTPILSEHVDRPNDAPDTLLVGTKITHWTGLAVAPRANKLLIAAGTRGLLSVPASFGPTHATADRVGTDDVHDVRVQADLVFALASRWQTADTIATELVILDPATLKEIARHGLELGPVPRYGRFVD